VRGRDIQKSPIKYVAYFVKIAAGKRFNPHRNGRLSKQDAGGTVFFVHVFAGRRVGISTWHFWHGSKGTQSVDAETLKTGRRDVLYWPILLKKSAVAEVDIR
jgi:hypothetical protein